EAVGQSLGLRPVHGDLLATALTGIGRRDPARSGTALLPGFDRSGDPEHVLSERDQLLVRRATKGTEGLQIVDGFEKARLALGVVSHERHPFTGNLQVLNAEVPETAQ